MAAKILSSNEERQAICNAIVGASFRDIDKALNALLNNKRLTREQLQLQELEESVPEKFGHESQYSKEKRKNSQRMEYLLDTDEVNRLLNDSVTSKANEPHEKFTNAEYPTYSQEEALKLINNDSI